MQKKLDFKKMDAFLRKELKIPSRAEIHLISNRKKGWENRLRKDGVLAVFGTSEKDPTGYFFIVYRHGIDSERMIKAICHEYIHVSQVTSGKLVFGKKYQIWKNQKIDIPEDKLCSDEHGRTSPWEKEAYAMEGLLASKLSLELSKKSFIRVVIDLLQKEIVMWPSNKKQRV